MYHSMTAYAIAEFHSGLDDKGRIAAIDEPTATGNGGKEPTPASVVFAVSARSVNSRYLDLSINLPREFAEHYDRINELVRRRVRRGKLDFGINWVREPPFSAERPKLDGIESQLEQLREIYAMRCGVPIAPVDPVALLSLSRKADSGDKRKGPESRALCDWPVLLPAIERVLDAFDAERQREGDATRAHLRQGLADCQALWKRIAEERKACVDKMRERLRKQVAELTDKPNPERLEEELLYLLKRHDIEEEQNRLGAHFLAFEQLLEDGSPTNAGSHSVAKRINFMLQEMGREANTIGSKSASHSISTLSIEIKLTLEQLREQVANIE